MSYKEEGYLPEAVLNMLAKLVGQIQRKIYLQLMI